MAWVGGGEGGDGRGQLNYKESFRRSPLSQSPTVLPRRRRSLLLPSKPSLNCKCLFSAPLPTTTLLLAKGEKVAFYVGCCCMLSRDGGLEKEVFDAGEKGGRKEEEKKERIGF